MSAPLVVTGGGGWIGAAVVRAARAGGPVVAVGRAAAPGIRAVDLTDAGAFGALLDDVRPEAVVHAAGRLRGTEEELHAANAASVTQVLAAASVRGIPVVTVGSAAEWGDPGPAAWVDDGRPERPATAYGRSKLAGTRAVRAARAAGAVAVSARLVNVAGPGLGPDRPLGELVARVRALPAGGGVLELADAAVERDWVTLPFAARALVALARHPPAPAVVAVCSGRATTIAELARALGRAVGRAVEVRSRHERTGPARVVGDPGPLLACTGLREAADPDALAAAALGRDQTA